MAETLSTYLTEWLETQRPRLAVNPCVDASLPRHDPDVDEVDDDEPAIWSAEQMRTFLELTVADPLHELWVVAATTGMRRGELLGLRWCDVDLDQGVLHVRRVLSQLPDRLQLKRPKTSRTRTISIDDRTGAALERTRQSQERARSVAGDRWDNGWDLVFTTEDGQPLDPLSVTCAFRDVVAQLPLPRIRLHDVRHCTRA